MTEQTVAAGLAVVGLAGVARAGAALRREASQVALGLAAALLGAAWLAFPTARP